MLAAGAEHLAVLEGDRVCGLLSATDLLGLDDAQPDRAPSHAPRRARRGRAGAGRGRASRSCSCFCRGRACSRATSAACSASSTTRVVARLIDFSICRARAGAGGVGVARPRQRGSARVHARLRPGQRARVRDSVEPEAAQEVDDYFARLGADVNDGLVRCGIGVDNNGVLAGNRQWRMSKEAWLQTFDDVPARTRRVAPDPRHRVVRLSPDARAGWRSPPELTERMRAARHHAQFMRLMARTATGYPVALGFRGQLATGHDGDPPGQARPQARRRSSRSSTWCASTRWRTG